MVGGVPDQLEPYRGATRLGRRRVNRADADVVDREPGRAVDLIGGVGGKAEEKLAPHERPGLARRHVVLADVSSISPQRARQVGAIVDYEQCSVLATSACEPLCGRADPLLRPVLDPELNDVDAATQRGFEELVGLVIAHQVKVRGEQPPLSIAHAPSLPGVPRYDESEREPTTG